MAVYKSLNQLNAKVQRFYERQPKLAVEAMTQAGYIVRNRAVTEHLSGPAMPRGVGSDTHGTLQPRSGTLRRSVRVRIDSGKYNVSVFVGTDTIYAGVHEFGSDRMPQRSFLTPSLERSRKEIAELLLRKIVEGWDG